MNEIQISDNIIIRGRDVIQCGPGECVISLPKKYCETPSRWNIFISPICHSLGEWHKQRECPFLHSDVKNGVFSVYGGYKLVEFDWMAIRVGQNKMHVGRCFFCRYPFICICNDYSLLHPDQKEDYLWVGRSYPSHQFIIYQRHNGERYIDIFVMVGFCSARCFVDFKDNNSLKKRNALIKYYD